MVAYITDTNHTPDKWQEVLAGREKGEAIVIVEQDRTAAEEIPNGEGYKQTTLNKGERIYLRTSKQTGNSWEVRLDDPRSGRPAPAWPPHHHTGALAR